MSLTSSQLSRHGLWTRWVPSVNMAPSHGTTRREGLGPDHPATGQNPRHRK
jgi:hypothetical protein